MRYERAIGLNMSGLFTAEDAKLFQKTEENGIIFQKVANIGITLRQVGWSVLREKFAALKGCKFEPIVLLSILPFDRIIYRYGGILVIW